MFGRMMNNYYYGKSGKGDFRKEDLPTNRRELFRDTLRTRLSGLCRLNLLYMLVFLPMMIVLMLNFTNVLSSANTLLTVKNNDYSTYVELAASQGQEARLTEGEFNEIKNAEIDFSKIIDNTLLRVLLWLIPCIAITGPFTTGLAYVTRNWARDEHAFIWTDFRDAITVNWKQGLVLSCITSVIPTAVYVGWRFYGQMAERNALMIVPQVLVVLVALVWSISVTYMYPLAVTYDLKMKDVIRNGLLLGVARLPMSVGIRLLHCVPALIGAALIYFWNPMIGMMILFAYYVMMGFSLSRFITASYTNAVFDKYLNPRIEGAKVNQGLRKEEDDGDDEDDGEGDTEN